MPVVVGMKREITEITRVAWETYGWWIGNGSRESEAAESGGAFIIASSSSPSAATSSSVGRDDLGARHGRHILQGLLFGRLILEYKQILVLRYL